MQNSVPFLVGGRVVSIPINGYYYSYSNVHCANVHINVVTIIVSVYSIPYLCIYLYTTAKVPNVHLHAHNLKTNFAAHADREIIVNLVHTSSF